MADFSHMRRFPRTPHQVAAVLSGGHRLADHMVLEAIDQCAPPLLSTSSMIALRRELDDKASRRGRPKLGTPTRRMLATQLKSLKRDDVPAAFINWLVQRLKSGRSASERTRAGNFDRLFARHCRDMTIIACYDRIYAALDGADVVEVPDLGRLAVPKHVGSRSDQALAMTQEVLRQAGPVSLPARRRMLNIISEKSSRKT